MNIINILSNYDKFNKQMSNIFKSNSRFSSLIDDAPQQKKDSNNYERKETTGERYNSFKSERNSRSEYGYRGFSDRGRDRYRLEIEAEIKAQKEFEEREKERIKQESLKIENFPQLVLSLNKVKEDNHNINYMEKVKKEEIKENIDKDLENLQTGWVLFKRDPLTKEIITKKHPKTYIQETKPEQSETQIARDVLNALVELHKKRTSEYIENYGYDEWEKMFKTRDWRECEAYLEEMEDNTDTSDYENDDYENDDYENDDYENDDYDY